MPRGRERHGVFMIQIPQAHPSRAEKRDSSQMLKCTFLGLNAALSLNRDNSGQWSKSGLPAGQSPESKQKLRAPSQDIYISSSKAQEIGKRECKGIQESKYEEERVGTLWSGCDVVT